MTVEADELRGDAYYNEFYKTGGWKYSLWKETRGHRKNVVKRFGLRRGMRVLEVACGAGLHTAMLTRMGFDAVGVDRSSGGIEWARQHHPEARYVCCDFREMPFEPQSFDVVLARGCSHYHYDLMSRKALHSTATIMRFIRPGGMFIMIIASDLSGQREPDKIWQNTLEDYRRHFEFFGLQSSVDWVDGMAICALYNVPAVEIREAAPREEAVLSV
ncbi:MAG: class I SAM-dependent methyltransferase [Verrucomicrobiales bacterium]|nr:class I SAM-dependent methyltransferase [Verrucomicrobiales bacterium]